MSEMDYVRGKAKRVREGERESGPPEATEEKKGHCVPRSRDV